MLHSTKFFAKRGVETSMLLLLSQTLEQKYNKKTILGDLANLMAVKKKLATFVVEYLREYESIFGTA
jgi:hypothetical protein